MNGTLSIQGGLLGVLGVGDKFRAKRGEGRGRQGTYREVQHQ